MRPLPELAHAAGGGGARTPVDERRAALRPAHEVTHEIVLEVAQVDAGAATGIQRKR